MWSKLGLSEYLGIQWRRCSGFMQRSIVYRVRDGHSPWVIELIDA